MAKTSVDIPQLKFNKMSTAKYEELKLAGQLNDNEFYITPDGGTLPEVNESTNDFVLSNNGTDLNWIQETEYTKNRIDSKLDENIRTNCLTKIPQDIKLELVDGFIYIKAGSKIYFPDGKEEDGTNKFKEVVLTEDIKSIQGGTDTNVLLLIKPDLTAAITVSPSANFSGDTDPNTQAYSVWYDTSTNYIKHMPSDLSGYISGFSFPVCVENQTDGLIESITQIFNGFGYIGSTVFALPDVEGIIPNGRNVDGSLNNIKFTTTNVLLTGQFSGDFDAQIVMSGNDIGSYYYSYDDYNNLVRRTDTNEIYNGIILGNVSGKNNILTSLKPKNVFQLIDRNDTEWLAGLGMPSERYIDLEEKENRAVYQNTYGDGYIAYSRTGTNTVVAQVAVLKDNTSTDMSNREYSMLSSEPSSGQLICPIENGRYFSIIYNGGATTEYLRFIYPKGRK